MFLRFHYQDLNVIEISLYSYNCTHHSCLIFHFSITFKNISTHKIHLVSSLEKKNKTKCMWFNEFNSFFVHLKWLMSASRSFVKSDEMKCDEQKLIKNKQSRALRSQFYLSHSASIFRMSFFCSVFLLKFVTSRKVSLLKREQEMAFSWCQKFELLLLRVFFHCELILFLL
jgi:hypothetical protein